MKTQEGDRDISHTHNSAFTFVNSERFTVADRRINDVCLDERYGDNRDQVTEDSEGEVSPISILLPSCQNKTKSKASMDNSSKKSGSQSGSAGRKRRFKQIFKIDRVI